MRLRTRRLAMWVAACAALATVAPIGTASATVTQPGGREFYVMSMGNLTVPATADWVRLAFYNFQSTGTIGETFWYYAQGTTPDKAATGITTAGCATGNCTVWTSAGFEDTASAKTLTGTYVVSGSTVTITWPSGTETWDISNPKSDLTKLDLVSTTGFTATQGTAFGSNASTNSGVSAGTIASLVGSSKTWTGAYRQVDLDTNTVAGTSPFVMSGITKCNTWCIRWGGGSELDIYRTAVSGNNSRKNFHELHRTSYGECYNGNPHLQPFLQILGDGGAFHGWVGIEASLFPDGADYIGQMYYTD